MDKKTTNSRENGRTRLTTSRLFLGVFLSISISNFILFSAKTYTQKHIYDDNSTQVVYIALNALLNGVILTAFARYA